MNGTLNSSKNSFHNNSNTGNISFKSLNCKINNTVIKSTFDTRKENKKIKLSKRISKSANLKLSNISSDIEGSQKNIIYLNPNESLSNSASIKNFSLNTPNGQSSNTSKSNYVTFSPKLNRNFFQSSQSKMGTFSNSAFFKSLDGQNSELLKGLKETNNVYKIKEELLEAKLKIDKLNHEISILQEKIKSNKSQLSLKDSKIEHLKKQNQEIFNLYKKDNTKSTKEKIQIKKTIQVNKIAKENVTLNAQTTELSGNKPNDSLTTSNNHYIISTLNILIELIELFIMQKPLFSNNSVLKTNNENNSYSIDVYDSYHVDDDKRISLIEQIQSIVLSKLKFLGQILNINFEKEIQRVSNWNNLNNNLSLNYSNVKYSFKKEKSKEREEISNTSSELNSSSMFNNSPKFFRRISFESIKDQNFKIKEYEDKVDEMLSVRLNTSAQNDSLDLNGENHFNSSYVDNNNNINSIKLNVISSFGNLNNIIGSSTSLKTIKKESQYEIKNENNINDQNYQNYEEIDHNEQNLKFNSTFKKLSIDLNDEPTEFNLNEICVNNNENHNSVSSDQPKILIPITAHSENNLNISFTEN